MRSHSREIIIYYNSESSSDRRALAYAKSISKHIVAYDHSKNSITSTNWKMILSKLDREPKLLLNKAHPYYQKNIKGKEFNDEDWINILQKNPDLIKAPIAISGSTILVLDTPTDVLRLT
ncbi:MAG TPA: ArsC/Spx/MgsR family protein [Saprospiraceae bacterium]|nr:hypothetical protein [Saprospiraceae bacterium]MCB9328982.1 glutaredoxin [Lewinellaceae bacterium]HPK09942.1 ArsC/Spx/MgsR family protein [Saprospiraceae bacterium]HRX29613.1 ArsC/Spx/MgsR family protein [Saprospiraceae bacterium]